MPHQGFTLFWPSRTFDQKVPSARRAATRRQPSGLLSHTILFAVGWMNCIAGTLYFGDRGLNPCNRERCRPMRLVSGRS
jgi:hypothetical protein